MPRIAFAAFEPDRAGYDAQVTAVATNVLPIATGIMPVAGPVAMAGNVPDIVLEAFQATDIYTGAQIVFAGTAQAIYQRIAHVFQNVTKADTIYAANTGWVIWQYLNFVIAVNGNDPVQRFDLTAGGRFEDLSADAPASAGIFAGVSHKGQVLLINSDTVYWSDILDPTSFSTGLAGGIQFEDGGPLTAIVSGEAVVVFQRNKARRLIQTGGAADYLYQQDELTGARGCVGKNAAATRAGRIFYMSDDGPHMMDFAGTDVAIGSERVNRFLAARLPPENMPGMRVTVDFGTPTAWFSYRASDATGERYSEALVYNWELDRWAHVVLNHQVFLPIGTEGFNLDEDVDDADIPLDVDGSLDDPEFAGGSPVLGVFVSGNDNVGASYCTMTGNTLAATVETVDFIDPVMNRKAITSATPIIDTLSWTVQVGAAELLSQAKVWGTASSPEFTGTANFGLNGAAGRVLRNRLSVPAATAWTRAEGVELNVKLLGVR